MFLRDYKNSVTFFRRKFELGENELAKKVRFAVSHGTEANQPYAYWGRLLVFHKLW